MSSSITIPTGPTSAGQYRCHSKTAAGSSSGSSYSSLSSSSAPSSPKSASKALHARRPSLLSELKFSPLPEAPDEWGQQASFPTPLQGTSRSVRLTSLLTSLIGAGSALSKQECTVINIGAPDGPPRLISYLSSSQGFMWNPEIFLPSYIDCDYTPLENRRDPVHEIYLSDEEVKNMLPE